MASDDTTSSSPSEPTGNRRWVRGEWCRVFLEVLSEVGIVSEAAKLTGIARTTVSRHCRRDPEFARQFHKAMALGIDAIELEVRRRALYGTEEPLMYQGKQVGTIVRQSDQLLMFLLEAYRPRTYGRRVVAQERTKSTKNARPDRSAMYAEIQRRIRKRPEKGGDE